MLADPMGWRVPAGFFWLRASPLADASGVRRWWTSGVVFVAGFSNLFTGTLWSGSSCRCSTILLILWGFAQGSPTLHLSKELGLDDKTLLRRCHQLQGNAFDNRKPHTSPFSSGRTISSELPPRSSER